MRHCPNNDTAPGVAMARFHAEDGAANNAWIIQLVIVLLIVGLLGTEAFKLAAAGLGADTAAGEVMRVAEDEYARTRRLDTARDAATVEADAQGVTLVALTVDANVLEVTVQRDTDTLFLHRIAGDAAWLRPAATRSTGLRR